MGPLCFKAQLEYANPLERICLNTAEMYGPPVDVYMAVQRLL